MLVLSGWCHAQSVTPDVEYKKLIQVDQSIHPLGEHPFGEKVDLSTGELSFEETDVSLPGNGPLLQLSRTLSTTLGVENFGAERPFADWDLNIPRIETATANQGGVTGWEVQATNPLQRCTYFGAPPDVPGGTITSADTWSSDQWWYGYHLIVPGEGSQTLLADGNSLSPTIGGQKFWIATKQNWVVGCGVTADDGGEGFLAIAPDGTRYTFAHLFYRPMTYITKPGGTPPDSVTAFSSGSIQPQTIVGGTDSLARREAFMYVTQVQDRFGNTLNYHYDASTGYLTSITASDGREVDVTYVSGSPLIQSITAKATNVPSRTWTYSYNTTTNSALPTLTGVTLPDGSAWSYNLVGFQNDQINVAFANCNLNNEGTVTVTTTTGTVTTPTGLTGTFAEAPMLHGRSYVTRSCWGGLNPPEQVYFLIPNANYQQTITSETITGAGLSTETWSYSYSAANQSWTSDACASTNSCPSTVYTDVTDPGGNDTRYTFSNRFDATEGQLQRTDYYSGAAGSTLLRSVTNTYANPTGGPWPTSYGIDLQGRDNYLQTQEGAPLQQRTITQGGQNYTWQALAFDAYAQPTDVKRYNDIAGQSPIEETTAYLNDTNLWVLGLPQTVANVATGEVESSNSYNGLDELTARARFGQTLMNYTWNSAGQLASFTDGDNHTTNVSNYYRGIPRTIGYPDGTSESLAVDDLGQITSITDQAGHTTGYSYDAVGRIAQVNYPYDSSIDSASWYPKVFTYAYVTSAERGVGAGHWRRTTTQGSATDTTYFDATLRPVLDDSSNGNADISTATGYDWRGLTTFASYPVAGSPDLSAITAGTRSTYDALGRLTQSQQDSELGLLTTTTQYVSGPGTQVTDPRGKVTTTYFQAFDQPVYNAPWSISAPDGVSQGVARDIYGEPTAITQSGNYGTEADSVTKTLIYDSYHRLCRTTEPETGSTVMAYDGANNLAWSAEGQTITESGCGQDQVATAAQTARSYDPMNRVLTIAPPAGTQSTSYTYDALGHVHTAVSGVATQGFAYNSLGQLTGESLQVAGFTWALGYGYDAYGHRSTVTYPAGMGTSEIVSYAPDAWGRPTQAGNYATGVGYFPNGQVESFAYGNGRIYAATQNARLLTSGFSDGAGGTTDVQEALTYDADGNITAVTDPSGLRTKSFGYDDLNRLTSATASNLYGTESYTYDPINNLRTRLTQGQTLTYNYDATNKLTSITQGAGTFESVGYNPQGDVIADYTTGTTLAFDAKHQLTGIPGLESYSYDAAGRRVVKQPAGGSPTYYFYGQAGQLMYQYALGTATTTNFIYLGTHLVAQHDHVQLSQPGAISFGTNPTAGSSTVSWGSSPAATSYTLEQSGDNGSTWSTSYSGSATSTTVSGLAAGGYVYRVQACIGSNCSGWTTSATLGVWPAIPTVSVPGGTINGPYTVSWTAPAGATGYTVQESLNGGAWSTVASNTTATSLSRPGTTTGSYTYQVEASDAYGTAGWSATSAAVSVNTNYGVVPSPVPTLSVPAASSTGSATVSWTAASPVTGYTLQQSSNGGSTWTTTYSGTATSAAITGLGNGSYTYQVQACNDTAGNSVCTAWVRGGTLVVTHPPASAPSLSAPASSYTGSYTVSWTVVATATSYTLQVSSNGGSTWSTAYSGGATSWGASGQGDGSYTYRVQACNVGGCGPWSGNGMTTVLLPPASAPSLSVPGNSTNGSYTVSWGAVATATSYTLQISIDSGGWSTVQSSGATSWGASGQATGTYGYRVQACNAGGCGPWSGTGTTNVLLPPGSAPSLSVPSDSATGSYTVSWGAVATAATYTLQESLNGGGWSTVQSSSATSWNASGRTPGTYAYHVQACNASGCGPWSGSASIRVMLPPLAPAYVSAPDSEPYPSGTWVVSWASVSNATSYNAKRTNTGTNTVVSVYSGSGTSVYQSNVVPGTYVYSVQACNAWGCSGWQPSDPVTVSCTSSSTYKSTLKTKGVQPMLITCP
jgi:YD repeat-containing protein